MEATILYQSQDLLAPVKIYADEDHDIHATYDLPAPVPWECKEWVEPSGVCSLPKLIKRARVCVATSDRFAGPHLCIVPIDEHGKEWPLSSMHIDGFGLSPWTAYRQMGFGLAIELN